MKYLSASRPNQIASEFDENALPAVLEAAVSYMKSGTIVDIARSTFKHPDLEKPVAIGHATDGEWVWPLGAIDLIEAGAFLPEADFLLHVKAKSKPPASLDSVTMQKAADVARAGKSLF